MHQSGGSRSWRALVGTALMTVTVTCVGCGGAASTRSQLRPAGVPAGAVAVVGNETITAAKLKRHAMLLRNGRSGAAQDMRELQHEALPKLLLQASIEAEAARRGVTVPAAAARRQVEEVKARYPTRQAFLKFLGGLSERDLLDQLRLATISEQLVSKAQAEGTTSQDFLDSLPAHWKRKTKCIPEYRDVASCG
jgi:hypothetical protein